MNYRVIIHVARHIFEIAYYKDLILFNVLPSGAFLICALRQTASSSYKWSLDLFFPVFYGALKMHKVLQKISHLLDKQQKITPYTV